jgi:hypothetical protein
MSTGIVFSENESNDFNRSDFEVGIEKSFSDFAYYLKTRDRSKFKPFSSSLKEWKKMASEVEREEENRRNGTEHTGNRDF